MSLALNWGHYLKAKYCFKNYMHDRLTLLLLAYILREPWRLSGADPGFLEEGIRCVEEGVLFVDFISFFLIFGFSETKLFNFHGIFKNWGRGRGVSATGL